MITNVKITKGASNWRIYQQRNGKATIDLEGVSIISGDAPAWVRVVTEYDKSTVVDWTKAEYIGKTEDDDGTPLNKFKVSLTLPAGGLYRIDTAVWENLTRIEWSYVGEKIYHIGVGDVFVITGQSNSAGYGRGPAVDPPEFGVHLCKNSEVWTVAAHPFNDAEDTKHPINREPACDNSPYLAFGRLMKKALGYPIGFIQESLGGSPISRWNTAVNGDLYKSMIESVKRITDGDMQVAGILWYQGCSDADVNNDKLYYDRFEQMVSDMRRDFRSPDLPVYTVQLNKVLNGENLSWAIIREAQRMAARNIQNVFVVPAFDLSLNDAIHNSSPSNIVIGERLARAALEGYYKKPIIGFAPDISSAVCRGDILTLSFDNVRHYLSTLDVPAADCGFVVEDEKGAIALTYYSSEENRIILKLERIPEGKACVSFAKTSCRCFIPPVDLGSGLPILTFDNMEIEYVQ
jgi:hypothetical protein